MTDWVPPGYSLTWAEEFDGPAGAPPSPRTWQPETGGHGWGNQELQYYTDSTANAALDGAGRLAITARRADPALAAARYGGCQYTSARLISKNRFSFRYGFVTARIKLPPGRVWPAFWLLGQNIDEAGWPRCGEIDVMENFGTSPAEVFGPVHGPGYSGADGITGSVEAGAPLADDFHRYSIRWEPDEIGWYLLINIAVGGTASIAPDESVSFPQTMLIDHIRVYTRGSDSPGH